LYDFYDDLVDMEEISITVCGEPPGGVMMVWIESLTTDKEVYEINEVVDTTVTVRRGNDMLTYVWEGTLALEVFDDAMVIAFEDSRQVCLPCGGSTETHDFEYALSEPGDYLVRASLYDFYDDLVDIEETSITVCGEPSGGNGTKPPNHQDGLVWIESLITDKEEYDIDEVVYTTVTVERGDDWLTYVWEGTLVLEVFDDVMVIVFDDARQVWLPHGGATETHEFQYALSEAGDYLVRATLYDFNEEQVDVEETIITVCERSGGNGTVPPGGNGTEPPDDNGMGISTGDKSGIFQEESSWQMMIIATVSIAITALSAPGIIRCLKGFRNGVKKS
jgi:hypothetical protein